MSFHEAATTGHLSNVHPLTLGAIGGGGRGGGGGGGGGEGSAT